VNRTYTHLRGCTKNKEADGSGSRQGTAYVRTVAEVSWIKFHNELGPQQRISVGAAKQWITEMDRLSIPE